MAESAGTAAEWVLSAGVPAEVGALANDAETVNLSAPVDFPLVECSEGFPADWGGAKASRGRPAEVLAEALDATGDTGTSFEITRIRAIAANRVLVEYTGDPGPLNPSDPASSLRPENWALLPIEASGTRPRYAQRVRLLTDETWDLVAIPQLLGSTPPAFVIEFDGVLTQDSGYRLVALASPAAAGFDRGDFSALVIHPTAHERDPRTDPEGLIDIANPFLDRDSYGGPLSTYQLDETGDIAADKSEVASARKRIARRVLSAVNAFVHLPGYGVGMPVKALLTLDRVRELEAGISAQVRQEPDLRQVRVFVGTLRSAPNVLAVRVSALVGSRPVDTVVPIQIP